MAQATRDSSRKWSRPSEHEQVDTQPVSQAELKKKGERITGKLDDLLDEIDEVLEENAEEFVKGYVQRGGQ
jgi:prokaryotic ubiquitin-like protein Pup